MPWFRSWMSGKSPTEVDAATAGGLPLYLFFEQKDPFVYVSNDEVFAAWCGERPLPAECRGILKAVAAASQLLVFLRLMEEKFGHEITRIVRVHLLIIADRAPDFQFSALLRAMADVIQREAQLEEWLGSKPIARRIARTALLTIPVSPYFIPAEKGSPAQVDPPSPQEDVIEALSDLLCNAMRDAQRIFEPAVRALALQPESIKGLRGRDNSTDGTPATESHIQWSRNPGRFERYLQIRHDNPLFLPERRTVERRALMAARSRDAEEREGFQAEMMSHVNELTSIFQATKPAAYARVDDYRVKLEALIQKAAELGPSVEQDRATLWKLWNSLVEDMEKSITQWEVDADKALEAASAAHRLARERLIRFGDFAMAQIVGEGGPVPHEELAAFILSHDADTIVQVTSSFDPEAKAKFRSYAGSLFCSAMAKGSEIPGAEEKLKAIGA
jgi:hypothetical protein